MFSPPKSALLATTLSRMRLRVSREPSWVSPEAGRKYLTSDGDFGALESLLAGPGLLGPQTLKAFLYMCYRQQFLEYIDNRELVYAMG